MAAFLIYLCVICWAIFKLLSRRNKVGGNGRRPAKSTDGHVLTGKQDITCRQFGHKHSPLEEPEMRFLVHEEPEQGYILLNGVKMRITEADHYENRI